MAVQATLVQQGCKLICFVILIITPQIAKFIYLFPQKIS